MDYRYQKLGDMAVRAHNDSLGKGESPTIGLRKMLAQDSEFSGLDINRLAEEADQWRRSGPRPNLDDPSMRGLPTWGNVRRSAFTRS